MSVKKRMCIICGKNEAVVPDRDTMSPIRTICIKCHRKRLMEDMSVILGRTKAKEDAE